ncbi:MAG: TIM barrel protein [Rhizobiales bacterium]|nr:TIM barrel protein [Hyphomicrobiales bacterium]
MTAAIHRSEDILMAQFGRLALHTWTIDTTPLAAALEAAREGGFDAVELRRIDFDRCYEQGMPNDQVLDVIRAAKIPVCTLGCEYGWLFAKGEESTRLFDVLEETCENAVALNCPQVMCAPGQNVGTPKEAVENLKRGADICGKYGLTLAIEFNSQHAVINSIPALRAILNGADRPNAGMLLDAYHLQRSGAGGRGFADVAPGEVIAFQFSDVPDAPVPEGVKRPADRLPPGQGIVQWDEVLSLLAEKGYDGHLNYEAPNPMLWERSSLEVAREGVESMRALIAKATGQRATSTRLM